MRATPEEAQEMAQEMGQEEMGQEMEEKKDPYFSLMEVLGHIKWLYLLSRK